MEVIRKQGDRSALLGVECIHCQRFYDALESWGTFDALPGCGHISQGADPQERCMLISYEVSQSNLENARELVIELQVNKMPYTESVSACLDIK